MICSWGSYDEKWVKIPCDHKHRRNKGGRCRKEVHKGCRIEKNPQDFIHTHSFFLSGPLQLASQHTPTHFLHCSLLTCSNHTQTHTHTSEVPVDERTPTSMAGLWKCVCNRDKNIMQHKPQACYVSY